jgi:hypothetical protein
MLLGLWRDMSPRKRRSIASGPVKDHDFVERPRLVALELVEAFGDDTLGVG